MESNGGPLAAVFAAPGKYIQGRDAVGRLGADAYGQQRRALLGGEAPLPEVAQ